MKAWNQDECKQKYVTGSPAGITSHMLCAGGKNMDSCMVIFPKILISITALTLQVTHAI